MNFRELVKLKREAFKAAFPGYKFSIRAKHYGSISISVLEGPVKLIDSDYEQVNYFYPKNGAVSKEAGEVLQNMADLLMNGNYTVSVDSDYGNIPNFYVHLEVGKWDEPYRWIVGGLKISVNHDKKVAREKAAYLKKAI